jgi:hypothetical protein
MKKKLTRIIFACLITTTVYPAEDIQQISTESQIDEPLWDVFGEQETFVSAQPRIETIDFSNPPRPTRLEVLMRRIGIPIFLRYIQLYNWVRRCVYWIRMRANRAFSGVIRSTYHESQHH